MRIDVITLFPAMFNGFARESMMKRAEAAGAVTITTVDPRDFARDARRTVDDKPYGGGPGMLMKPEPLFEAIESVLTPEAHVVLMAPAGRRFDQAAARRLARERHLILVCGHYEGIDERVRRTLVDETLSIGDYVLTNGTLPAAVVTDAVVRLLPGVLGGGGEATEDESFTGNLLEHPQFTRPPVFRGMKVPEVLLRGDHGKVARWKKSRAEAETRRLRPDLLRRDNGGAAAPETNKR
ncbi:MAG: tRNA (guanosine(37)-N1)-methyltransferase TrmD [Kiritimatiellae bacterium]|nr:tRNA (guanosine(37)-N1)-methyltransferase TrmD [Kiritimatiellia bacterium]